MFMFNKILNNSNLISTHNIDNIILRYIPNDKNFLYYKDINLNIIAYRCQDTSCTNNTNDNFLNFIEPIKNVNVNSTYYHKNNLNNFRYDYVGYSLEDHFDKSTSRLIVEAELEGYENTIINNKLYLIKYPLINKNCNYSTILAHNGEYIEVLGINRTLDHTILNIMENIQYTDKFMFALIQEKIINNEERNIKVSKSFNNNLKYYDLKFKMNYFEYQSQIKQLLL